jgi:hypothetical protein
MEQVTEFPIHKVLLHEWTEVQRDELAMGLLGVVSRAILIYTCFVWILGIAGLFVAGQTFLAIFATVVFMIPFYTVVIENLKMKRIRKAQQV